MADAIPSRLGQINGAGDALALYLKQFSGEVLTAFNRSTAFRERHIRRTIASGKSAQFPATGLISAFTHTPGEELLGTKVNAAERVISIEGQIIADAFIANIDEAMNHYDYRSIYSNDIGQALSKKYDKDVFKTMVMAARQTTPNVLGVYPNDTLTSTSNNAAYDTDGPTLFNALLNAGYILDTRDVPAEGRNIFVDPLRYGLLVTSEKPFDYRLNDGKTGLGGYAEGKILMINSMPIVKTNNFDRTNYAGDTSQPAGRQHDFTVTSALVAHESAAGTVALQDVTMETAYDPRRQGWLTLGKYLCGHDYLRPEAAYELRTGAPAA